MHIFITGGTGLIGSALIATLLQQGGYHITVLTRSKEKLDKKWGSRVAYCPSLEQLNSLSGYDVIVNLAGEPIIGKRWSKMQKAKLCNSRWDITRRLTELIKNSDTPPRVFISGSAVGYYGAQSDQPIDEKALPHDEFTHRLCKKWEELALEAQSEKTRVCISRTGIVMAKEGGMLSMLTLPFRLGLGCSLSKGTQYISWIHIQDMVNALIFLMNTPEAQGIFNLTAPGSVTNKRFSKLLSATLYRPCLFRMPAFIVKLVLGESATMLLDGQRVVPQHLLDLHFQFLYERLDGALASVLKGK
ncbi:TIGR01777 family oxidoreductase [Dysgonomonas sp. Marseille-P4677]|uniref:TIGR01777 family oxidoreductase n=1 Tax=Dysgonomonas sp. Marseille-P4677 TaxID=2364790 RepID=UPI001913F7BE|nr:TIGR01777 family oxidoreductase [Dysgonomonas sp. Marseille-P4677]MBK5721852.1 TIGR01777 family oxidoreductase [Dysgonomonas sp. Marseille-P4677]